jgi:hypothetical protein
VSYIKILTEREGIGKVFFEELWRRDSRNDTVIGFIFSASVS